MEMNNWQKEVDENERFEFGANWVNYIGKLSDERVAAARTSLNGFLPADLLKGASFLDIGSGSGLHSLAAVLDGANVTSFDFDPYSVSATTTMRDKFNINPANWTVLQGSVLDDEFVRRFSQFDIVYSWGVLHHTGNMWKAIENTLSLTKHQGYCFIAIYNKQGWKSRFWWYIKKIYNKLPKGLKNAYALLLGGFFQALNIVKYTLLLKPHIAINPLLNYKSRRGMSWFNDIIDWMGGFPYEYASVSELKDFFKTYGFELFKLKESTSLGCNELLFKKVG